MAGKLFKRAFICGFSVLLLVVLVATDTWSPAGGSEIVRRYSRPFEFDYVTWEISTTWEKITDLSFGIAHHLNEKQQRRIVEEYFVLLRRSGELEQKITELYSSPDKDEHSDVAILEDQLSATNQQLKHQTKLAEAVLQYQISQVINGAGITKIGTPFPPILFHTTALPRQLIISPRDVIRQEESISLIADITLGEMIALEEAIEKNTDYSALVVPIGGVGTYPTMIVQTSYLPNLLDTAAHEWTHNYLFFRPLGMRYSASPALRTMNETTASISGSELMQAVINQYYQETTTLIEGDSEIVNVANTANIPNQAGVFNFPREMYETRIQVDEMLAEGEIEEAEAFMEARRKVFWENGYQIRKLNQAYFSFYGAYADAPYSAAGRDPVGEDVRLFRSRQPDLESFLWKMSWMYDYRQLRSAARSF